jgi:hypothetical protein
MQVGVVRLRCLFSVNAVPPLRVFRAYALPHFLCCVFNVYRKVRLFLTRAYPPSHLDRPLNMCVFGAVH